MYVMFSESNLYRSVTHRGECSTSLFTPSRCCKGKMGEAVAATRQLQYVRHKEGAELVIDARGSPPFVRGVGG